MKFKIQKAGGVFELEGKFKEIIRQASLIQSIPDTCPLCKGKVVLDYRKPKGYEYYSLKCSACGASKNFGVTKEDGSLFLRWDDKFEIYKNDGQAEHVEPSESIDDSEQETPF